MGFNLRGIFNICALLVIVNGLFMLLCLPFSLYYGEGDHISILISAGICLVVGLLVWIATKRKAHFDISKRDGYLIVTMSWLTLSLTGALPYYISGMIPDYTSAFFETMSGYTTTGASVLNDIEACPKGLLFWRSLTHWIGGMGIIVLTLAILPILGIGGMQLFAAESPGPSAQKLHPRIRETAKRLWLIYVILTLVETVLLMFGDMGFYDALNHSMSTMSTGGFSTKNASMAAFNAYDQYIVILFMFIAGTNFIVTYYALKFNWSKVWENEEFKTYALITLIFMAVVGTVVVLVQDTSVEQSIRDAMFQVVAILTTTGFVTADYTAWTPFVTVLFLCLMFFGGSAGSTSGAVKVVRQIVLFKNSAMEFKRLLHPKAIFPVRLNGKAIQQDIVFNVLAFFLTYLLLFVLGAVIMAFLGMDFDSAIGASAASIGNIGPGLGSVGPVSNFADVPQIGKWVLSVLMLMGRLEIFTVLILFTPYFWRNR